MAWSRRHVVKAGLSGAALAQLPARAAAPDAPSLETLAHAKGMHFGSALGGRGFADLRYSELKMPSIQPVPGEFHFERAERLLEFATDHGIAMRGHSLLWHHPRWLPRWLDSHDFGGDPRKSAEALLTDHIRTTTTRFGKCICSWDVVNEAVDNVTGEAIAAAFRAAPDRRPENLAGVPA